MERGLFALQRLSAMAMAPFVLVHLGLILYAARTDLTAQDILARTRGSGGWIAFYTLFVLSLSIHVPIGLRCILIEWTHLGLRAGAAVHGFARRGRAGRAGSMRSPRNHRAYWAFLGHRLSGLALGLFLPAHLYVLGLALEESRRLEQFLKFA